MRIVSLLLIALLLAGSAPSAQSQSKRAARYIEEVTGIVREHALYRDSLDWAAIDTKINRLSSGLRTAEACYPLIDTVMAALRNAGDFHSGFLRPVQAKQIQVGEPVADAIQARYLGDSLGYVKVPRHFSIDLQEGQAFANELQDRIRELDNTHPIHGWVVDLRGNRGGNAYPMIKGLSCLLGDDICAYIVSGRKATAISPGTGQAAYLQLAEQYRVKARESRVAVLIDSTTASSGELAAIAFQSLPRARFFGQPSAGYTTSNQTFRLSDGSMIYLATAYMADRTQKIYWPRMEPDILTRVHHQGEPDYTLEAARRWLRNP